MKASYWPAGLIPEPAIVRLSPATPAPYSKVQPSICCASPESSSACFSSRHSVGRVPDRRGAPVHEGVSHGDGAVGGETTDTVPIRSRKACEFLHAARGRPAKGPRHLSGVVRKADENRAVRGDVQPVARRIGLALETAQGNHPVECRPEEDLVPLLRGRRAGDRRPVRGHSVGEAVVESTRRQHAEPRHPRRRRPAERLSERVRSQRRSASPHDDRAVRRHCGRGTLGIAAWEVAQSDHACRALPTERLTIV